VPDLLRLEYISFCQLQPTEPDWMDILAAYSAVRMWSKLSLCSLLPVGFQQCTRVSLTLSTTTADLSLIIPGMANSAPSTSVSLSLSQGIPVSLSLPRFAASLTIFVHKGLFWASQSHYLRQRTYIVGNQRYWQYVHKKWQYGQG
jgi:hypothetical protein